MKPAYSPTKVDKLRALHDHVLVKDMQFKGRTLSSGLILPGDDGRAAGIRPRWAQVYLVGPEQKWVRPGQWVCVAHGRWTRGLDIEDSEGTKTIRKIDPKDILMLSDEDPGSDDTISDAIQG